MCCASFLEYGKPYPYKFQFFYLTKLAICSFKIRSVYEDTKQYTVGEKTSLVSNPRCFDGFPAWSHCYLVLEGFGRFFQPESS